MKISKLKAPYLEYDDIRTIAKDFYNRYNSEDVIPVPIEDIIELKLGIEIVPINSFEQAYNIDGFISNDFKEILVDENIYNNNMHRIRFTLAHEIGHMFLHREIYDSNTFSSIGEWKKLINEIDSKQYSFF